MTAPDVVAEFAELRHRIDVLESRDAIRLLRNRFHDFVNTDRWGEIGTLFTSDASLDYSYLGQANGHEQVTAFFARMPDLLPNTFVRQFIHAHSVEVDGDEATGTSHLLATPIYHGESYLLSGRFDDTYRREQGEWLFHAVTLNIWYSVPLAKGWSHPTPHHMSL
jgi:hypothetical protein